MSAKFPRILHLPFSPGCRGDESKLSSLDHLLGRKLVMSEKLDGSNLCMTTENVFARSHSGPPSHPSFDLAKALHAKTAHLIPSYLSIFGEWCAAVHSIRYDKGLLKYFNVFAIRDEGLGVWLSWDRTIEWAKKLEFGWAPEGPGGRLMPDTSAQIEEWVCSKSTQPSRYGKEREGVVIRPLESFGTDAFSDVVAKWVRKDHVQTDHWSKIDYEKQPLMKDRFLEG